MDGGDTFLMLRRSYRLDPATLDRLWWLAERDGLSQSAELRLLVRRAAEACGFRDEIQ